MVAVVFEEQGNVGRLLEGIATVAETDEQLSEGKVLSNLAAENLAQAIHTMTGSADMQRQATGLRDAMAGEKGIQRAVEIIQQHLTGVRA